MFGVETLEKVFERLKADDGEFARETLAQLATRSPQAMKVAFRQLRLGGACSSLAEELRMEYRIASRVILRPDFAEGVRAILVDNDNAPRWSRPVIDEVADAMLDEIFAPLGSEHEWTPLDCVSEEQT